MLAIMLSEIPFERLVSHAASPAISLLFPNETDYFVFNGLLSISIRQFDDWKKILWSDETWVNSNRYIKTWVTRQAGEE
jgi:hypothetical protein